MAKGYFGKLVGRDYTFLVWYGDVDDIEDESYVADKSYEVVLSVTQEGDPLLVVVTNMETNRKVKYGTKKFDRIVVAAIDTADQEDIDDLKRLVVDDFPSDD